MLSSSRCASLVAAVFLLLAAAPATAACTAADNNAFDFWLGEWNVYGPKGKLAGRNSIKKEYDGCVVHERYETERGYRGESLNMYDPARKVWHQTWVDSSGLLLILEGGPQNGAMVLLGQTAGKEYGCTLVGEGGGKLVIGGDVFVFPVLKDKAQLAAQDKLVQIVHDPVSQLEFNKKKGSVPVRLDVNVSSMDSCAQTGMKALQDLAQQIPSGGYIASPDRIGAVRDVITQFWSTKSMSVDDFVARVVTAVKSAS